MQLRSLLTIVAVADLASAPRAQCEEDALTAPGLGAFPVDVALSGETALLGFEQAFDFAGAAVVFEWDGAAWAPEATLTAPPGVGLGFMGCDVALEGDTALVGASHADGAFVDSGAVYVYQRVGTTWVQTDTLLADDAAPGYLFGRSLDLSGDTALVGDGGGFGGSSIYFFERDDMGTTDPLDDDWSQVAERHVGFFEGCAISGDQAVVGGFFDGANVFEHGPSGWLGPFPVSFPTFPDAVQAVDIDGDTFVAGTGAKVFVFRRAGSTWTQEALLKGTDTQTGDLFGIGVALEGNTLLAGAGGHDLPGPVPDAGALYLFRRTGTTWPQAAKLTPNLPLASAGLGYAVDLSAGRAIGLSSDLGGAGHTFPVEPLIHPLEALPASLSISAGGVQTFALDACPSRAGFGYLVLGTMSGTAPGFTSLGFLLPLNLDSYGLFTLLHPNHPPLAGTLGVLDGQGMGSASLALPGGAFPGLVGTTLHHAFLSWDPSALAFAFLSNAAQLELVP